MRNDVLVRHCKVELWLRPIREQKPISFPSMSSHDGGLQSDLSSLKLFHWEGGSLAQDERLSSLEDELATPNVSCHCLCRVNQLASNGWNTSCITQFLRHGARRMFFVQGQEDAHHSQDASIQREDVVVF